MGFCRWSLALAAGAAVAMAGTGLMGISHAAELIVAPIGQDEKRMASLRELSRAWESDTGNQLVWLLDVVGGEGKDDLKAIADVYIVSPAQAQALAQAKKIVALAPPFFELAPLLADMVVDEKTGDWLGAPLADLLPVIHYDQAHLAESGINQPPLAPSWDEVFAIAASASDPIGEVHGFCASGWRHGTLIRALLSDAGLLWLDPETGTAFAGASWHEQAQNYIRQLARSGPPNAASLTALELVGLLSSRRCALWLAPPGALESAPAIATPGASAFVSVELVVVAVAKASGQVLLAGDYARWLAVRKLEKLRESMQPQELVDSMLQQQGSAQLPGLDGWPQADLDAQEALRKMVDGLVSAAAALAEASQVKTEKASL